MQGPVAFRLVGAGVFEGVVGAGISLGSGVCSAIAVVGLHLTTGVASKLFPNCPAQSSLSSKPGRRTRVAYTRSAAAYFMLCFVVRWG